MSNTNKVNVPEAKGAMNRFKLSLFAISSHIWFNSINNDVSLWCKNIIFFLFMAKSILGIYRMVK